MANSFIDTYLCYAGVSAAPPQFHLWCALTALSASVMDHIWVESAGEHLAPNLYVFLVGPSGIGKGVATSTMMRVLSAAATSRVYSGMLTAQHLCDMLDSKRKQVPKVLLVTEELSLSVGDKALADRLIRLATALYACSPYEFFEGTRTHGTVRFANHCLCWCAGTTQEWLRDSIPRSAVEGGFFARVNCVVAHGPLRRAVRASPNLALLPPLVDHLHKVARLEGAMALTPDAEASYWDWFERRPLPAETVLEPVWARVPVHVLKLASLLSLGDGMSMTIQRNHINEARRLAEQSLRSLPQIIEYVAMSPDTDGIRFVRDAVREAGRIAHSTLVRAMLRHGLTASKVREHVDTLTQGGYMRVDASGRGRAAYEWSGRAMPALQNGARLHAEDPSDEP